METTDCSPKHYHIQSTTADLWRHPLRHHRRHRISSGDRAASAADCSNFIEYYNTALIHQSPSAVYSQQLQPYTASHDVTSKDSRSRLSPRSSRAKHSDEVSSSAGSGNEDRSGAETSEPELMQTRNNEHIIKDTDGAASTSSSNNDGLHSIDRQDIDSNGENTSADRQTHRPQHKQVIRAFRRILK